MGTGVSKRVTAQLEAANLKWGKLHCRQWETVADVAGSLGGTYLDLNGFDPNINEELFYVWFNTGSDSDPAITGKTGIEVTIASGDTAPAVAQAIKTALDGLTDSRFLVLEVKGAEIVIENRFMGAVTPETDSGSTGFTLEVLREGVGVPLGATQDAIELSIAAETVDITSNQTGSIIASQILQGFSAELTANLIEVTKERFDTLVGEVQGGKVEPMGGTVVSGYGEDKLFSDLTNLGGPLVLHPIRLPEDDYSADIVFWLSAPKPDSLTFDGTAPQQLSTTFTAYLDQTKSKKINLYARGDWTQEGLNA